MTSNTATAISTFSPRGRNTTELTVTEETITPETAGDYLAHNTKNRPIGHRYVTQLANALERGEWVMTGDSIKFAPDGTLMDGQHRLLAVIQSGVPIKTLVVRGVTPEAFPLLDQPKQRRLSDFLHMEGTTNARNVSAMLSLLWRYKHSGRFRSMYVNDGTRLQLLDLLEEHPDLAESLPIGRKCFLHFRYGTTLMATLHYILSHIDQEDADDFFDRLATGAGLEKSHPVLKLRERLIASSRGVGKTLSNDEAAALTFKAWNAYREGRGIGQLYWRAGGANPEPYPVPR